MSRYSCVDLSNLKETVYEWMEALNPQNSNEFEEASTAIRDTVEDAILTYSENNKEEHSYAQNQERGS